MNITVVRLHTLLENVKINVGAALRSEIFNAKSDWVCQKLQKAGFWDDATIQRIAEADASKEIRTQAWVASVGSWPVGFCLVNVMGEDRQLALYLVATNFTQLEQWEIADAIALQSIKEMLADDCPAKRNFWGYFPKEGWAARYATRCGLRWEEIGKLMIPDPNPILLWTIGMEELLKNIEALQKVKDG